MKGERQERVWQVGFRWIAKKRLFKKERKKERGKKNKSINLSLSFYFNKNRNYYLIFGEQANLTFTRRISSRQKWTPLIKNSFIDSGLVT